MTTLHQKLMRCSSIAAMGAASLLGIFPATAQTSEGNASNIESVVVSGTRLSIGGYEAPTPVTVIGVEQIQREAKMNLIDRQLTGCWCFRHAR
jgi:iron complex outermembrane receptor protein